MALRCSYQLHRRTTLKVHPPLKVWTDVGENLNFQNYDNFFEGNRRLHRQHTLPIFKPKLSCFLYIKLRVISGTMKLHTLFYTSYAHMPMSSVHVQFIQGRTFPVCLRWKLWMLVWYRYHWNWNVFTHGQKHWFKDFLGVQQTKVPSLHKDDVLSVYEFR